MRALGKHTMFAGWKHFTDDFQKFTFSNSLIQQAAGFAIGASTKDVIVTILEKVLYPALVWLAVNTRVQAVYASLVAAAGPQWMATLALLTWTLFEYALFVLLTFVLLEYVINRHIIGLKTVVPATQKTDFVASKKTSDARFARADDLNFNGVPDDLEPLGAHAHGRLAQQAPA